MQPAWQQLDAKWRRVKHFLQTGAQDSCRCRECGRRVGPFDEVCTFCSAANPARLRVSFGLLMLFLVLLAIVGLIGIGSLW